MTIVGTRPEIIRLSRVIALLDKYVKHILVHTGQNYDYELNGIFFKDMDLNQPDYFLNSKKSSIGKTIGDIIAKSEEVLIKEKPDALLVLGDTNSCLSAYVAKRLKIPIFHMEAGNRCFDFNVPEETNRRIIDHIADFNLVYTEHARRHLISEGLPHRRIYLTGSPMHEVLNYYLPKIYKSKVLHNLKLTHKKYIVISVHREENVDKIYRLREITSLLNLIAKNFKVPVIVTTHPRTRKNINNLKSLKFNNYIRFLKPFCFTDYIFLQLNALVTISDSGTISEESAILNFPAITLRQSMERPEAQDSGTIILSGFDKNSVMDSLNTVIDEFSEGIEHEIPIEYKVSNTSWRVLKLILGNAKLSNIWDNIYL
jgi:UDP-N-acetylglucosamine 2-epimerase (non-hydrolysing)